MNNDVNTEEFNIVKFLMRLWDKRNFILIYTISFAVLGIIFAIFQKDKYESRSVFVPQFSSPDQAIPLYSISSILSSAGALESILSGETMSPMVYSQLLKNVNFNKELMYTPLHFSKYPHPVTLFDYYNDPSFKKNVILSKIRKYTIGLPRLVLDKIKPEKKNKFDAEKVNALITYYSEDEASVADVLSSILLFSIDKKDFYFSLSATLDDALGAAELCQTTLNLLQKYITDFKIAHARQNLELINELYADAKIDFESKQMALAKYSDANRGMLTATTQTQKEKLTGEYSLSLTTFSEISKKKAMAEIKLKEDTPVFSTIRPVNIPNKPKNSKFYTIIQWIIIGICLSCCTVFAFDWLNNKGVIWPKNWQ